MCLVPTEHQATGGMGERKRTEQEGELASWSHAEEAAGSSRLQEALRQQCDCSTDYVGRWASALVAGVGGMFKNHRGPRAPTLHV